jgi:formylmethanofuran dehydrogenase subunit C
VTPLVLSLRQAPAQRLDLSPLVPNRLAGLSAGDIAAIALQTTRERVCVDDLFHVQMGDPSHIRFEGGSERFDRLGCGMSSGEIRIEGDAGCQVGRLMTGGQLVIAGSAGPWAASGMKGGSIEITGSAGDRLGGPLAGEMTGMRGGVVVVRGDAGARAGDRMRRGMIVIEGKAAAYAGSRMIAGTLIIRGRAGPLPGYLMSRGTIVAADGCEALSPTFADCGTHEFVANALMAAYVRPYSADIAAMLWRPWRRLLGDMAVIGKGEIFYPPDMS